MRWGLAILLASAAFGYDDRHLALLRDAQTAFEKVEHASSPQLTDASACVQTQAGVLSVALPAEESDLHYRKGFCQLAVAAITHTPSAYIDAALELERSGANMLAWLARRAGQVTDQPTWTRPDNCPASCQSLIPTANLWLGWLALSRGELDTAAQHFSSRPDSGWSAYVGGLKAFQAGRYPEAVTRFGEALDAWTGNEHNANPSLPLRLTPPAAIGSLRTDLGGAQLLAGDSTAALLTLDQAVLTSPPLPRAYYIRARAREVAGQQEPALADYNLASRAAFASATNLASGEAHLYRGILLYRRKDYRRAEEEFASALNFEIPATLRPDASAWRQLSAMAGGSCGSARQYLERLLPTVSPYFPKAEAQAAAAACSAGWPPLR